MNRFTKFLGQLENDKNSYLVETIEKGFKLIFEAEENSMLGYKVMKFENGLLASLASPDLKVEPKTGQILKFPGKGMWLGLTKEFVLDYYSGGSDEQEALLTLEFNPHTITSGNVTDKESVITTKAAKLVNIEYL